MAERRDEILDVARQLFARQGVRETTVRQIGSEAGVLSGSLYHHFASKLDMVDAILSQFCSLLVSSYESIAGAPGTSEERVRALVRQGIGFITQDRASVLMFQRESQTLGTDPRFAYLRTTEKEVEKIWVSVLEEGQSNGEFLHDVDLRLTYKILRDVVASSVRWHTSIATGDRDLADAIVDIVIDGIAAR